MFLSCTKLQEMELRGREGPFNARDKERKKTRKKENRGKKGKGKGKGYM